MTEADARRWVCERWGSDKASRLDQFGTMVVDENARQNLIAPSTTSAIWERHLLDSAQLVSHASSDIRTWLDVGTGAGFPGIVVALLLPAVAMTLVEPRRRRVEFLRSACRDLSLQNVTVEQSKVEALPVSAFDVITARAVTRSDELIAATRHVRTKNTRYILPRGRSGGQEVETLRARWQGLFHVEHSLTDPESTIIVADGIV